MDIEDARALTHKLNHGDDAGVGIAASITGWETEVTAIDNPDGDLLDVRIEQSKRMWWPLGQTGDNDVVDVPDDLNDVPDVDDDALREWRSRKAR